MQQGWGRGYKVTWIQGYVSNAWTSVRVGALVAVNPNGTSNFTTTRLGVGMCSGLTRGCISWNNASFPLGLCDGSRLLGLNFMRDALLKVLLPNGAVLGVASLTNL